MDIELLDHDCLLHIFKYLPLLDVIKLEELSPSFEEPANMYYRTIKTFKCTIRDMYPKDLCCILSKIGPYLTSFTFSGGLSMPKDKIREVTTAVSLHCTSLERLSLNYIPLDSFHCDLLTNVASNLNKLDLGNCNLKDWYLNRLLDSAHLLKRLSLQGNPELTGQCLSRVAQLEELNFSYSYILESEYLLEFLKQCRTLRSLNVSGSYMLDWRALFKVLIEYPNQLEELYMMNLGVDETQVPYEKLKHLKVFEIKGQRLGT